MLNLKLGLAALGMEVSAWTTVALLHERSDAALAGYLLLHALACVLLSLTLLPLLRQRQGRPGWTLLLIMACSYAIPVAGFVGVVVAFVFLTLYRRPRRRDDFEMLESPEFDQHEKRRNSFRHIGMRSFLTNTRAPLHARMRAMSALQYVGGRTATPLLRTAMGDASEDLRLLAYGMLDNLEKRINHAIDQKLQTWHGAQAAGDEVQSMDSARQLADLYWELVYQALVQGDLRDHACTQALHYCEYVLAQIRNDPRYGATPKAREDMLKNGAMVIHTALDVNSDAVAYAVLQFAMNTAVVNGQRGKGNFKMPLDVEDAVHRRLAPYIPAL